MVAHRTGGELSIDDVKACMSETMDTNTFAMLDAVGKNRKDEAFRLLHDMIRCGENPYRLLSTIASQIELMLCVKELRQEGKSPPEIKSELNIHELRIKKAMAFSEKFSINELKGILMNVYKVDKQIKTGLLESEMALEMMIAEI
jgi:DNA polymerase III subunit delta